MYHITPPGTCVGRARLHRSIVDMSFEDNILSFSTEVANASDYSVIDGIHVLLNCADLAANSQLFPVVMQYPRHCLYQEEMMAFMTLKNGSPSLARLCSM